MKQTTIIIALLQGYITAIQVTTEASDQVCNATTAQIGKYQIKYDDIKAEILEDKIGYGIQLYNDDLYSTE